MKNGHVESAKRIVEKAVEQRNNIADKQRAALWDDEFLPGVEDGLMVALSANKVDETIAFIRFWREKQLPLPDSKDLKRPTFLDIALQKESVGLIMEFMFVGARKCHNPARLFAFLDAVLERQQSPEIIRCSQIADQLAGNELLPPRRPIGSGMFANIQTRANDALGRFDCYVRSTSIGQAAQFHNAKNKPGSQVTLPAGNENMRVEAKWDAGSGDEDWGVVDANAPTNPDDGGGAPPSGEQPGF